MFKVASLNGNGANQTLLSMNNLVEGNIHGGIIDNTTGTKQNVTFIVGTVEFPLSVDANGTTPVSKINVPSGTTVQVNAPIGVNVSISYIETAADASAALTTIQRLVSKADTSATNAGIRETNANNSAINAKLSAENANESETNASNSEIRASKWAVNPEDTEVLTGQFSAYHWARKSQAVASGDVIDDTKINNLLTWSSTKINSFDVANVKLSGNQTIGGVKTFSSSPIVPTPTAGTQVANKAYVDTNIGQLMPKVFYPTGEIQYLCKLLPTPYDLIFRRFLPQKWIIKRTETFELRASGYNTIMDVPYLSGCFMFLRTEALKKIGLFDENIFMYGEETDLCRRLIEGGYRTIFFPKVHIFHHFAKGSHKSWRLTKIGVESAIYYFNKWGWFFDKKRTKINKEILDKL
jgi:hypothetical protein